jgi:hypothetical protein
MPVKLIRIVVNLQSIVKWQAVPDRPVVHVLTSKPGPISALLLFSQPRVHILNSRPILVEVSR